MDSNRASKIIQASWKKEGDFRGKFWDLSEEISSIREMVKGNRRLNFRIRKVERMLNELFRALSDKGRLGPYLKFKDKQRLFLEPRVTIRKRRLIF
jgi:hypothetical protein